jgi:hypothetical protein
MIDVIFCDSCNQYRVWRPNTPWCAKCTELLIKDWPKDGEENDERLRCGD